MVCYFALQNRMLLTFLSDREMCGLLGDRNPQREVGPSEWAALKILVSDNVKSTLARDSSPTGSRWCWFISVTNLQSVNMKQANLLMIIWVSSEERNLTSLLIGTCVWTCLNRGLAVIFLSWSLSCPWGLAVSWPGFPFPLQALSPREVALVYCPMCSLFFSAHIFWPV